MKNIIQLLTVTTFIFIGIFYLATRKVEALTVCTVTGTQQFIAVDGTRNIKIYLNINIDGVNSATNVTLPIAGISIGVVKTAVVATVGPQITPLPTPNPAYNGITIF